MAPALPRAPAQDAYPSLGQVEVDVHAAVAADDEVVLARVEAQEFGPGALVEPAAVATDAPELAGPAADGADRLRGHVGTAGGVPRLPLEERELRGAEALPLPRELHLRRLEGQGLRLRHRGVFGTGRGGLGLEGRPGRQRERLLLFLFLGGRGRGRGRGREREGRRFEVLLSFFFEFFVGGKDRKRSASDVCSCLAFQTHLGGNSRWQRVPHLDERGHEAFRDWERERKRERERERKKASPVRFPTSFFDSRTSQTVLSRLAFHFRSTPRGRGLSMRQKKKEKEHSCRP